MNTRNFNKYELSLHELAQVTNLEHSNHIKSNILSQTVQPLIHQINQDQSTSAVFIQLPLPETLKPFT